MPLTLNLQTNPTSSSSSSVVISYEGRESKYASELSEVAAELEVHRQQERKAAEKRGQVEGKERALDERRAVLAEKESNLGDNLNLDQGEEAIRQNIANLDVKTNTKRKREEHEIRKRKRQEEEKAKKRRQAIQTPPSQHILASTSTDPHPRFIDPPPTTHTLPHTSTNYL